MPSYIIWISLAIVFISIPFYPNWSYKKHLERCENGYYDK